MDKNKGIYYGAAGYDAVARKKIKELEDRVGSGGGGGGGADGGYYKPSVNSSGVLSWTASKSGMPSVASTNIVNAVLAALPAAEGGSY